MDSSDTSVRPFLMTHRRPPEAERSRQADVSHDIVQETFVRIWEHRAKLKPHLSFLSYALRISGNLVRDAARRRATQERLQGAVPPPSLSEGDDPAEALQLAMLEERLIAVINDELTEKCRRIFLLSRFEGKSNRGIADLLGLSVRTVEHQINHALKVVRRKLKRQILPTSVAQRGIRTDGL